MSSKNDPAGIDNAFDRIAQLLEFPADFPIKVMGNQQEDFGQIVAHVVAQYVENFDAESIVERQSRNGRFVSLTVPVRVHSREQLQSLYVALADHELVRIVL